MDNALDLTADIVAAYLSHNHAQASELPDLIAAVNAALERTAAGPTSTEPEKPVPHMPIKKTVTDDYIISLEDKKHYKTLKRHLSGRGLTPEQYRTKWDLPFEYPMVAPNYARTRSELAKKIGLGQFRKTASPKAKLAKRSKKAA